MTGVQKFAKRPDVARAFTVELPYPPSVNNLFVNNSKTRGRYPSPEYKAWRKEAAQMLMAQRARCAVGPVEITITVQDGRGDIDNRIKACLDCLVENGIIDGDSAKCVRKVTAQWGDVVGALVEIKPAPAFVARKIHLRSLPDGKGHTG